MYKTKISMNERRRVGCQWSGQHMKLFCMDNTQQKVMCKYLLALWNKPSSNSAITDVHTVFFLFREWVTCIIRALAKSLEMVNRMTLDNWVEKIKTDKSNIISYFFFRLAEYFVGINRRNTSFLLKDWKPEFRLPVFSVDHFSWCKGVEK